MAIIKNIAVLNVMDIKEEVAKEITELKNIGLLMESDRSQELLSKCKKTNIGATIKIPTELNLKIISINGESNIDKEFLESLVDPAIFLVNGSIQIANDVDKQLFNEKIYKILLNGNLVCPKKLKGIIGAKSMINGLTNCYNNDYKYINETVRLDNRFLKGLDSISKIAFEKLMIIDDIDLDLLEEKISNIQVLNKLIMLEKYEDKLAQYIDDYYKVKSILIPIDQGEVKYFGDDIKLDDIFIKRFNKDILYVEGNVEVLLKEDFQITDYISYLICNSLTINEKYFNQIKGILSNNVEVQIIEGKLIKNVAHMKINNDFDESVTITNMGKLIIGEDINADNFDEKVVGITNYGLIEAPKNIISLVQSKIKQNYGKIQEFEKEVDKREEKKEEKEDILYSNIAELTL